MTGAWPPIFSACWFRSTAPGFRNWHLPVHMGLLAHPRPCHRLAVTAAPHEPCTRELALLFSRSSHAQCLWFIYAKSTVDVSSVVQWLANFRFHLAGAGTSPERPFLLRFL